ncbi:MAG: hypothetical protein WC956_00855 [bacterium]
MPKQPHPEVSYFEKIDVHKRRKIAEARTKRMAKEERQRLKQLHWHRCGNCGMELEDIPFKGETIFKCFSCGSVLMPEDALQHLCGEEKRIIESLLDLFKF